MVRGDDIPLYNRETKRIESEVVMGEGFVRFLYETSLGRICAEGLLKRRCFSRFFGWCQDRPSSRRKILDVAKSLGIDLDEVLDPPDSFKTFNEFFVRRLKPEARPVDPAPEAVISPCDARLLAMTDLTPDEPVTIKGSAFTVRRLLESEALAQEFAGGTMLVYRLCPADYHRFHFPEAGLPGHTWVIDGALHSVSPIALGSGLPILDRNLRHLTVIESEAPVGKYAMVEVGAMCVGSVVQHFDPGKVVVRGQEKGLFRFGGSTVAVLYRKGRIRLDEDVYRYSGMGVESLVKLGVRVGLST